MAKHTLRIILFFLTVFIGITIFNLSIFSPIPESSRKILSHRGVHQTFHQNGLTNDTCTANRIFKPTHTFIENTVPSIEAAFAYGADIVEIDIRRTADNNFAVFHDGILECRTDGKGNISNYTMAELRMLDLGYGYTADNGQTFPLRGKGIGMMPSLDQILKIFPDKALLINAKSNNDKDADALATYLDRANLSLNTQTRLWAGPKFASRWRVIAPTTRIATKVETKTCAKNYVLLGWSGYIPESCRNFGLVIPENLKWAYWGWPRKTISRLSKKEAAVALVGALNGPTSGIDTIEQVNNIPDDFRGIVMTNRIEIIGPALNIVP